jgi:endonuclease-3 related protein
MTAVSFPEPQTKIAKSRRRTTSAKRPAPAQRLRAMHDALFAAYGPQFWWPARTSFEVILGAYLTQNTAWKAVERSLANLREAGALSIEGLRRISVDDLAHHIRPSGFYTRKAPALKAFVAMVDAEFGGSLDALAGQPTDALRRRLLALPGVGPETADAILLYALGHAVPVADEYLRRIAERHRLVHPAPCKDRRGYEALVQLTRDAFSTESVAGHAQFFNEFHALTVAVGKAHCGRTARCTDCPLLGDLQHVRSMEPGRTSR